jgi:hypothetical protein
MDGQSNVSPRTRSCQHCAVNFSYPVGKGKDRIHCSSECSRAAYISRRPSRDTWPTCRADGCGTTVRSYRATLCNRHYSEERKRSAGVCSVHKCKNPATRTGGRLCETHYYRERRTGSLDRSPIVGRYEVGSGYVLLLDPKHPLAGSNGHVYEHRYVAYEVRNGVCEPCFWCGTPLNWSDAVVDHLNEVKDDNSPGNLVIACNPCNRARGAMVPFLRRMRCEAVESFIRTVTVIRDQR